MKKFVIGVITYFIFIILYFIQANFFGWFTIAGISPNIFVIYILFLGLFTDNKFSLIMALLTGITLDLVIGKTLGATAVLFCLISIIANYRIVVEPLDTELDIESLKNCKILNVKGVLDYHGGKNEWIIP